MARTALIYRLVQRTALPSSCHSQGVGNPAAKEWSLSGRAVE
jgi:hypothetical protein